MGDVSGGEMGVFIVLFVIFSLEGALFSMDPTVSNQIWTPSSALSSGSMPVAPSSSGSCGWNIFCTAGNSAVSLFYGVQVFVYYAGQVFAVILEPVSAIIVIAGYSAQYGGMLAWFNGIAGAIMAAIFLHGLV